jgi:flagella basal body P-ring formation protein FlgA
METIYKELIRTALPLFFMAVLSQAVGANVDDLQPHQEIRQVAEDFVFEALSGEDVEVTVRALDSRLRLHRCEVPLEAFWSPGSRQRGATSVGVACEGEKPWKIYVRVNIKLMREVVVTARPLVRGDILQPDDVRMLRKDVSRINNGAYLEDASSLIGYELRQSVAANSLLYARMLQAPKLIRRGDKVTVLAVVGGLEVRVLGEALSDGGKGQMIRVRNLSSKRIVQGEVVSKGMVRIAM